MEETIDQLLAVSGMTREDLQSGRGKLPQLMRNSGVSDGPDLERVIALPPRVEPSEQLIDQVSQALRKSAVNHLGEPNRLFGGQVSALLELCAMRGLFADMPIGSGKTLVTLLAPTLTNAQRPVLIIPASLRVKTKREFAIYFANWHVRLPKLVSYQALGLPQHAEMLLKLAPDLLMLDEGHFARNLDAAVSRRIKRAIEQLRPIVASLSGTLVTSQLMDYHHHAIWSLGVNAPVPLQHEDAQRWANALDRNVGSLKRTSLGALEQIPNGFHEHFGTRCGVVPTDGAACNASIQIALWHPKLSDVLVRTIAKVEETGMRPDGEPLDDWDIADCVSQLALGFYYVWDPLPPDWWLRPRRGWRMYARAVLDEHLEAFDSELQIVNALDHGSKPHPPAATEGAELLKMWRAIRDKFKPNPVPVWLDDSPLRQAIAHVKPGTLMWVKYRHAGFRLDALGIPYYGGGTNPEQAPPGSTIAVSIAAHGTGKNLQAWHRNMFLTLMANADAWEQGLGRTHRAKQESDTVYVEIIHAIDYHARVIDRVKSEARANAKAKRRKQKLLVADWTNET